MEVDVASVVRHHRRAEIALDGGQAELLAECIGERNRFLTGAALPHGCDGSGGASASEADAGDRRGQNRIALLRERGGFVVVIRRRYNLYVGRDRYDSDRGGAGGLYSCKVGRVVYQDRVSALRDQS